MNKESTAPPDQAVDYKAAELEFERFAKAWHIFTKVDRMTKKDRESFEEEKAKIIEAIVEGNLLVKEDGNLIYKLIYPLETMKDLTLTRPKASALWEFDRYDDDNKMKKIFAYVGAFTGQEVKSLGNLEQVDFKPLQSVAVLFLAS